MPDETTPLVPPPPSPPPPPAIKKPKPHRKRNWLALFLLLFILCLTIVGIKRHNHFALEQERRDHYRRHREDLRMWEAKRAAERERSIPLCDKPTHNIHDFGPCKAIYPRHIVSNNASSSGYTLCYPSAGDGGFWLAQNEHPATLQHLGINRFNTSLSTYPSNPDVEDAFCHRFKQAVTTATYFPSANKYLEYGTNGPLDVRPGTESHWRGLFTLPRIATCWPEDGGVWIMPLQTPSSSSSRSSKLPPGSVVLQQKLNAALTTEERCYVLKRHGAGFYLEPSQSPFLKERVGVGEELLPPRVEIGLSYSGRSRWRPLRKIPAAYVYRDERYWRGGDML